MAETPETDLVVLLDDDGRPSGTAPRATVHGASTPLHLAFSCYLFDREGRLRLTRRAVPHRARGGAAAADPAGGHQADLARRVDELVLRPPAARRGRRGRRSPLCAPRARHR